MKARIVYFLCFLLLACANETPKEDAGLTKENTPAETNPASAAASSEPASSGNNAVPTVQSNWQSSEEDRQFIGHMELNKLYFRSLKEYQEKGKERMENIYRQPLPDAFAYFLVQKDRLIEQRKKSKFKVSQPAIPDGWDQPNFIAYNTELAELEYRYGDMDNLGYGWPVGFDPFSGESTPRHDYPFYPEPDDPAGTDRIMVISGYEYDKTTFSKPNKVDGYTKSTERPYNLPEPLKLSFDLRGMKVKHALLQLFLDDFQPATYHSRFQVWINNREAIWISSYLNELKQGGPIGKLLSVQVLPEFLNEVEAGKLTIRIDGPDTNSGDGFGVDFIRLLVNPKSIPVSALAGKVINAKTKAPIEQAMVKVSGGREVQTGAEGLFQLSDVPMGMVVIQAAAAGYKNNKLVETLEARALENLVIKLEPETQDNLAAELEEKGKLDLYGIYFDTDKAVLKPESEKTLQQVLAIIRQHPDWKLEIGGHTDAEGNPDYNIELSEKRANAVVDWLKKSAATSKLEAKGYGATQPVADNSTVTGRALNRRVEIKLLK